MSIPKLLHKHRGLLPSLDNWKFTDTGIILCKNYLDYLSIDNSRIDLFGINIMDRLITFDRKSWDKFDTYYAFLDRIKRSIVRLNHIGFGYKVDNIGEELKIFRESIPDDFVIVEEASNDPDNNRWFFIRHKTDKLVTKIELVMYLSNKYKDYCPQFQLDIDTDLTYEELSGITKSLFGKDFFFWKYDIPNYGVVMAMGKIGQINGVKILLGIGTRLRKRQLFKKA